MTELDITYHYPPELMALLIDTIPLLCRGKKDVLLFCRGAGVNASYYKDVQEILETDPTHINKYEITRRVLSRLNEKGERTLRERREILKRVVEYEDFSSCWPSDQLKAKGLVAEIRRVINVKDSFTRMAQEREKEKSIHKAKQEALAKAREEHSKKIKAVHAELLSLFKEVNPQKRGKILENVLNNLFKVYGIQIKEAFTRTGDNAEGMLEQVDGVVAIDSEVYLVEMKWWNSPLGPGEVSQHIVRIFSRAQARAIIISASGFTDAAINTCREALIHKVIVLCSLEEMVRALEQEANIVDLFREKVHAAITHKNPFHKPCL
jgi:restriction endonuclease Mrr